MLTIRGRIANGTFGKAAVELTSLVGIDNGKRIRQVLLVFRLLDAFQTQTVVLKLKL